MDQQPSGEIDDGAALRIELQPDLDLSESDAERILEAWLGRPAACSGATPLKGGMVNTVLRLDFDLPPHHSV